LITVGFTGAQAGMTMAQRAVIHSQLQLVKPDEAHHGDCIGADSEFHSCVKKYTDADIVIHPPENNSKRAYCKEGLILSEKPYLTRNKDIVDASDVLFATPAGAEVLRSGTWSTIRYAKKKNVPVVIIYPDGNVETHA